MSRERRILYLHPAAAFGGASKSLIELYRCLSTRGIKGEVVTPRGTSAIAFLEEGMKVNTVEGLAQFDNTQYGYYRCLRWLILLREIYYFPGSVYILLKLRKQHYDLIHINEITLLHLGICAKLIFKLPLIIHVRSVQRFSSKSWRVRFINYCLHRYADAVIAIDETVAKSLPNNLPLNVIHNGINIDGKTFQDAKFEKHEQFCIVGFLGVLIPLKGIYELVEAMRILKERRVSVKCLIVGENPRNLSGLKGWIYRKMGFSHDVRSELERLVNKYDLGDAVKFEGFVKDVRKIYSQLDILCFPSHLNAAGRPVFEAAFFGVPSVVAIDNPTADAIQHEITGLAIKKSDPILIADAIQRLVEDKQFREGLGVAAKKWAMQYFSIINSASLMNEVYKSLIIK